MIKATKIHSGQYRPYGDSHDVWVLDNTGRMTFDEILAWCRENLINGSTIPLKHEFYNRYRTDKTFTYSEYFNGYVNLYTQGDMWTFEKVVPYAD